MLRSRLVVPLVAVLGVTPLLLMPQTAQAVVSNKLTNPGFETGSLSPWQTWGDSDADSVESDDKYGTYTGVHRRTSAYQVYTFQTVTGLANGTYVVTGHFRSSGTQTAANLTLKQVGADDVSTAVPAKAKDGWIRLQMDPVTVSTGTLEVGVYSQGPADSWLKFDNIRLDYIAPNPAETTEGTNLVTNPGFESTTGWSSSGTAARVTNNARSGSASMKLGPTAGFTYQDITSGFSAGQTVVLSGHGKAGAQGGSALAGVQSLDSSGTVLADSKLPFFATSYGKNSTTAVLPAGTAKLRVYIWKGDGDRTSLMYLDDLRLYVSSGATFYVDASEGSNGNSGTSPSQAWQTLSRANERIWAPGDTLVLKGGQTHSGGLDFGSVSSGTMNHPITVSSYGGGRAVISATASDGILMQDASGFHVYNLQITGPGVTKNAWMGIYATNNTTSTQRGLIGIDNVEVSGFWYGINVQSRHGKGFGPVNIIGSITRDNYREGTTVFGYDAGGGAANNWYSQGIFTRAYVGWVTSYNNHEWSGIIVANTDDAMIEHSTAYHIGHTAKGGAGPVGIYTFGTKRGTVQFNTASDVGSSNAATEGEGNKLDGDGFDISWNNYDALYQYNLAYDNEGYGFLIDNYGMENPQNQKMTLRYNISHGNCQDSRFCGEMYLYGPVYNAEIYNNTFRATKAGEAAFLVAGEWNSSASVTGPVAAKVRNNIFSVVDGGETVHITAAGEPDNGQAMSWTDPGEVTFQGNLYHSDGNSIGIWDEGTVYSTLAAWRAATGQEKNGSANTGVQGNPQFVDANTVGAGSADNLKIGASSAAKDAGLNLSSLFGTSVGVIDYFGTALPQGSAYDIGAHERP